MINTHNEKLAYRSLTPFQRRELLLSLHLDRGMSQSEIARHLGLADSTVSRGLRSTGRIPHTPHKDAIEAVAFRLDTVLTTLSSKKERKEALLSALKRIDLE